MATMTMERPTDQAQEIPERRVKIAVDIDSTLYDFETPARDGFLRLAAERDDRTLLRGAYCPWTEWRSPADACGLEPWLDVIDLCHDTDAILGQAPFAGAVETCQALAEAGNHVMYISNRKTETEEDTRAWLIGHGFLFGNNTSLVTTTGDKKPYMAECQYLIDDRPKTLVEFVYDPDWDAEGRWKDALYDVIGEGIAYPQNYFKRKALGLLYEYNRALTDIPNIYLAPTWGGINDYLVRKGILESHAYAR